MSILAQGGLNFKDGAGKVTRKVWWEVHTTLDSNGPLTKSEYVDLTVAFSEGGINYAKYVKTNGTWEATAETRAAFDTWKTNHAGQFRSTWGECKRVEPPALP